MHLGFPTMHKFCVNFPAESYTFLQADDRKMTIEESLRMLVIQTTSQYLLSPSSKGKPWLLIRQKNQAIRYY
jgi:hypothetical protein